MSADLTTISVQRWTVKCSKWFAESTIHGQTIFGQWQTYLWPFFIDIKSIWLLSLSLYLSLFWRILETHEFRSLIAAKFGRAVNSNRTSWTRQRTWSNVALNCWCARLDYRCLCLTHTHTLYPLFISQCLVEAIAYTYNSRPAAARLTSSFCCGYAEAVQM